MPPRGPPPAGRVPPRLRSSSWRSPSSSAVERRIASSCFAAHSRACCSPPLTSRKTSSSGLDDPVERLDGRVPRLQRSFCGPQHLALRPDHLVPRRRSTRPSRALAARFRPPLLEFPRAASSSRACASTVELSEASWASSSWAFTRRRKASPREAKRRRTMAAASGSSRNANSLGQRWRWLGPDPQDTKPVRVVEGESGELCGQLLP